jgi:hypothetical protein
MGKITDTLEKGVEAISDGRLSLKKTLLAAAVSLGIGIGSIATLAQNDEIGKTLRENARVEKVATKYADEVQGIMKSIPDKEARDTELEILKEIAFKCLESPTTKEFFANGCADFTRNVEIESDKTLGAMVTASDIGAMGSGQLSAIALVLLGMGKLLGNGNSRRRENEKENATKNASGIER